MSDPMIAAAVVLLALAAWYAFGRKAPPSAGRKSSPSRLPEVPRLDEIALVPVGAAAVPPRTPTPPTPKPPPPAPEISPLLAEALAEVSEAYTLTAPPPGAGAASHRSLATFIYEGGAEVDEPTGAMARVMIEAIGDTDVGRRRARNEDALLLLPEQGLFAIADGMGGYHGGEVASSLAVDSLRRTFESQPPSAPTADGAPRRALEVVSAMQSANEAVFRAARSEPELRDMGTTLVALRFIPQKQRLYVGHVGDSRCYRLRGGELRQLTTDHALKELGLKGPRENDLFKAIGIEDTVAVDVVVDKPLPGDLYLLCSDGLSKMVTDERIREVLLKEEDPEAAVYGLIEEANDAGGRDNVTVLLARVSTAPAASPRAEAT